MRKWYAELTGEALSVRRGRFFNPTPPNNEEDVAKAIQKWEFDHRGLKALDPSIEAAPTWMFSNALKKLLIGALATEIFTKQTRWVGEGKTEEEQFVDMKRHMGVCHLSCLPGDKWIGVRPGTRKIHLLVPIPR